jgi:hypothetical protein
MLGSDATAQIRADAEELRVEAGYAYMSEEDLREMFSELRPFEEFRDGRTRSSDELGVWWGTYALGATSLVAAEAELIHRAQVSHRERAAREAQRRGVDSADPISVIRKLRGERFADEVERRATVLASHLDGRTREELQWLARDARDEIRRAGGLVDANPESLARVSAFQFERNLHNEQLARARVVEADYAGVIDRAPGRSDAAGSAARLVSLDRETLDEGDRRFLAEELAGFPSTRWLGSPEALHRLGIEAGAEVTESAVMAVLDHRSGVDAQRVVQSQAARDGAERLSGRTHVLFTVTAPRDVQDGFYRQTRDEQDRIKSDLLEVADATLSRVTSDYGLDPTPDATGRMPTAAASGYVAIATTDQEVYRSPNSTPAQVNGVIVAISRPDGALVATDGTRLVSEPAQRLANEVAAAALDRARQREAFPQREAGAGFEM